MTTIKTYAVTVEGFGPIQFSARTAAKARAACYRQYLHYDDRCTFQKFLQMSSIRRVTDHRSVGKRVLVDGKPATTVLPACGYDEIHPPMPAYMRDDSDVIFTAHRLDVKSLAPGEEAS
jgi:hypothetical protein